MFLILAPFAPVEVLFEGSFAVDAKDFGDYIQRK